MATLSHFPSFPSHKLFLSDDHHNLRELKFGWYTLRQQNPPHKRFRFCASSIKKSRKVKSNAELCDDIREFVAAIGFPEGRLPTMKEFLRHGRSDLAYIVRRRGYKRIGELLESTKESDLDGSTVEKDASEDKDEKPKVVVGDFPTSIEVSVVGHSSFSSVMDTEVKLDDNNCVLVEASADLSVRETASCDLEGHNENGFINKGEGSFVETEVSVMEYGSLSSEDPAFVFGSHKESPLETSTNASLGERGLNGGDEMVNIAIESDEDLLVEGETEDKGLNGEDEMVNIAIESVDDLLVEGETRDKGLSLGDETVNIAIESDDDLLLEGETEDKGLNGGDEMVNIAIESVDDLLVEGETGDKGLSLGDETVNIAIESDDDLLVGGETRDWGLNVGDETVKIAIESAGDLLVGGEAGDKGLNGGDETANIAIESADELLVAGETATSQDGQSEDNNKSKEDTSSAEVLITENNSGSLNIDSGLSYDDDSSLPVELSALSLEERVANFVQYGHLDTIEESQFLTNTSEHSLKVFSGGNGAIRSNESAEESLQLVPAVMGNRPFRDDYLSAEGQSIQFDKNLDVKTSKRDNQFEISHLKFMLHRKELELSRLKEQIEKEKRDLSVLQAKAESEICKAQKLVLEKDAELHAAEETLSGLVEVHFQYHGEGEIVEVAGSFNGWHHWIKMDPQPSSSITDSVGARKSKLWSTVLWLYPGVYEIKFIVDGEWKIDPQRESVTHGNICNNILRVHS